MSFTAPWGMGGNEVPFLCNGHAYQKLKKKFGGGGGGCSMPEADISSWEILLQTLLLMGDTCDWPATPKQKSFLVPVYILL